MARKGLGDLAAQATADLAAESPAPPPHSATTPTRSKTDATADAEGPHYLTLTRKEARVRDDQADSLSTLTRQLNKNRGGAGERITDNTLIRVAIDLLLDRQRELAGATEHELRKSVGL